MSDLRDHGLGPSGTPTGSPTWERAEPIDGLDPICPNCGGCLCIVQVPIRHSLLQGGRGISQYLGCPACPFAGPAIMRAAPETS